MFHIFHCYWKTCQKVQSQTSVHWRPACLFYWHDFYGNRKINVGSYTFLLVSRNHVFNTFYNALSYSCPLSRNWLRKYKYHIKVEKIWKGNLDSIPSASPSVKIQIMGGNVCLRCKGKLLGIVNKLLKTKSLLTSPSNVLPLPIKQTFPPIIWIFTECEGDGIKSKLSS